MDLRQYVHAVLRYWWVIALPVLLGIGLGVLATTGATPVYRASVTFFVTTSTSTEPGASAQVNSDEFAQRRVNSYLRLLGTDRLAEMVVEATDLELTAGQVQGMIGAKGDIDTVLFTATVTSESRATATAVAAGVATEFVKLVDEVETTGEAAPSVNLDVVDGPNVSQLPQRGMFALAWRAVLGGLVGLGIALLLELRDQTLRSEDDLIAVGAGPVLGTIPFDRLVESAPLLVEASRHSNFAEAFRQLRTNLQFVDVEHRVQVLVVTSSVPGEGKSVTCSNLALSLAAAGRQVLLIEADLRLPRISHYFGIDRSVGLTDVLIGRSTLGDVVRPIPGTSLTVLPSGHAPPNPSELLGSDSMRSVLAELRTQYDIIVVDTPPLLPVADGAVAAAWADGVVLLVRTAKTPRQQITLSLRALSSVGARLVGSVMTMAPQGSGSRYSSYDYRAGDDTPDGKTSVPSLRQRPSRERTSSGGEPRSAPERSRAPAHVAGASRQPVPPPPQPAEGQAEPEPVSGFNTHIETLLESGSPEAVRAGLNALKLAKVDEPPEAPVPAASTARKQRSTRGKPRQ